MIQSSPSRRCSAARLHKNETYKEQADAEAWAAEAAKTIKDAEGGAHSAADWLGMSVSAARSILKAYEEATREQA